MNFTPTVELQLSNLNYHEFLKVMRNAKDRYMEYKDIECHTVPMALCYLINFDSSLEGKEYWMGVCEKYKPEFKKK